MTTRLSKELVRARKLMDKAKFGEALKIIEQFEKGESVKAEDLLSTLLIKGRIYLYRQQFEKRIKISERAYQMSRDLGLATENVEALIGKASIGFIGDLDMADSYVTDAEKKLNSLADDSSKGMLRRGLLSIKSWILLFKGDLNGAVELAEECLKLTKEQGSKLDLAATYLVLGWINLNQGNSTEALDYAMKSLDRHKKLNHAVAIADDYSLIARIYLFEGDYDQAISYCKKSKSIKEITRRNKLDVLGTLATIYYLKSEMNRALKYRQKAVALAKELNIIDQLISGLNLLGYLYINIGKCNLAIESFERSLTLSEKWGYIFLKAQSLTNLSIIYIDENSREKAYQYFSRLSELYNQTKDKGNIDVYVLYLLSKAYMLKTTTKMRDHVESQELFKELIDHPLIRGDDLIFCVSSLCDLLFEELSIYNDQEILDEIILLIKKSLIMAETARNYYWLAETKLLQAKLALIRIKFEKAKVLMVQAQRIADLHGLNLLASRISNEHDKLLGQVDLWDTVKKEGAPMAERVKLASTSDVLERIQGKRAVESPELVNEEPVLLLIMDNSGIAYFNHPFIANWDHSDLFSLFMSAFNNFSSEIFSKSIDRIQIGENTILINPVESFLVCYVIKGQSYPALQKLTRFSEAIRDNLEIWQALNKSVKTSEMIEFDKFSILKSVINEIFIE